MIWVNYEKKEALEILSKIKPELVERFGVTRLALFGSTAVDKARPDSDVDIVVAFDGPATSKRYFGVQFFWKTNSAILLTWLRRRQCGLSCGLTSNGRLLMSERE